MKTFEIRTHASDEFVDVTAQVRSAVLASGVGAGVAMVYCPHTTAGLTIQENTDPALKDDLLGGLEQLAPRDRPWKHGEGNAHSHLKAALLGSSCMVPFQDGRLQLGRWQAIYFVEFDGPRTRAVQVKVLAG